MAGQAARPGQKGPAPSHPPRKLSDGVQPRVRRVPARCPASSPPAAVPGHDLGSERWFPRRTTPRDPHHPDTLQKRALRISLDPPGGLFSWTECRELRGEGWVPKRPAQALGLAWTSFPVKPWTPHCNTQIQEHRRETREKPQVTLSESGSSLCCAPDHPLILRPQAREKLTRPCWTAKETH